MINYQLELRSALGKILPTYHEMVLHSGLSTPCISYMELNNYVTEEGDTLAYSTISFQIKVWGTDLAAIQFYVLEIDKALRPLGLKRISATELYDNESTMIQKILTYEGIGLENY